MENAETIIIWFFICLTMGKFTVWVCNWHKLPQIASVVILEFVIYRTILVRFNVGQIHL